MFGTNVIRTISFTSLEATNTFIDEGNINSAHTVIFIAFAVRYIPTFINILLHSRDIIRRIIINRAKLISKYLSYFVIITVSIYRSMRCKILTKSFTPRYNMNDNSAMELRKS